MGKVTVRDMDFTGKKVIMRVDFNVPLNDDAKITDDSRIRGALPTIRYILEQNPEKLILMSHLGRPKGKVVESLRMNPVAQALEHLLGESVKKLDECIGDVVKREIEESKSRVVLLENLRFHPEEEKGDESFAKELAALADVYVNDAFGTAHRAHASTTIIAKFLHSCIGFLIEKEIKYLSKALNPSKPFVVILGGAKVSDKINVVENILQRADVILIGGAMAYTFLKSKGVKIGNSRVEEDKLELAEKILKEAEAKNVEVVLPLDHVVVEDINNPQSKRICGQDILDGFLGVDIGPQTVEVFKNKLSTAKTVLWNGPLGIFETPEYAEGTKSIALFLGELENVEVIVGGGDSAAAAKLFGVEDKLSHISTGGGASLEFLEGKELPGIAVIPEKS